MTRYAYGWVPSRPDFRDHLFAPNPDVLVDLPRSVDLRNYLPPCYDQEQLGSCTANALGAAFEYDQMRQSSGSFTPSRLHIYYNERAMEGTIASDSGADLRDGVKVINQCGVVPEEEWPYDTSKFTVAPPQNVIDDATLHVALSYQAIPRNLQAMKACLAGGLPFVFGFSVYDSFEQEGWWPGGLMPIPQSNENVLGGHAVLAVGYTDSTDFMHPNCFIIRNSWSRNWSVNGHFFMPAQILLDPGMSSDFWAIASVK